jgi:hypothetical protein
VDTYANSSLELYAQTPSNMARYVVKDDSVFLISSKYMVRQRHSDHLVFPSSVEFYPVVRVEDDPVGVGFAISPISGT